MKRLYLASLLCVGVSVTGAQQPLRHLPTADTEHRGTPETATFHTCPAAGRASQPHPGGGPFDPALNTLKNRTDLPSSFLPVLPSAILEPSSPDLKNVLRRDWPKEYPEDYDIVSTFEGLALVVEGYVVVDHRYSPVQYGAQEEGPESTNCGAEKHSGDVHVWITAQPNQDMTHAFVVELTPRVREAFGEDDSQTQAAKLQAVAKKGLRVRVSGWLMFDEEHPEQLGDRYQSDGKKLRQRRATLWELHPVMKLEVEDGGAWHALKDWTPR